MTIIDVTGNDLRGLVETIRTYYICVASNLKISAIHVRNVLLQRDQFTLIANVLINCR